MCQTQLTVISKIMRRYSVRCNEMRRTNISNNRLTQNSQILHGHLDRHNLQLNRTERYQIFSVGSCSAEGVKNTTIDESESIFSGTLEPTKVVTEFNFTLLLMSIRVTNAPIMKYGVGTGKVQFPQKEEPPILLDQVGKIQSQPKHDIILMLTRIVILLSARNANNRRCHPPP